MDALSSQLAVRKVFGSGSATILDVRLRSSLDKLSLNMFLAAMRRVLHLKMVTQCAMLEDFGIFLVLADKVKVVHILRVIVDDLISLYFPPL